MLLDNSRLKELLPTVKNIAIIGAKDKPGQPVDRVGRYLIEAGFTVFPVHPVRTGVWGLETYTSIEDIPEPIDLVDIFRASEHCLVHAQEYLRLSTLPKIFWMQQGIHNTLAKELLADHNVFVVEDLCLMVEHKRLFFS